MIKAIQPYRTLTPYADAVCDQLPVKAGLLFYQQLERRTNQDVIQYFVRPKTEATIRMISEV